MCGIAGFLSPKDKFSIVDLAAIAKKTSDSIFHRGPDREGVWIHKQKSLVLCHRRLSILDLSDAGNQPMVSNGGRYICVFNGEIYNYIDLKKEIEKFIGASIVFSGHSDTEVLLAAFNLWGVPQTIPKLTGMFAIAVYDRDDDSLFLIRDRAGEKPLYYGWQNGTFLFGSELKALRQHPDWIGEIDRESLGMFLRHNYIPAPNSIYKGIFKLLPGSILKLDCNRWGRGEEKISEYWSLKSYLQSRDFGSNLSNYADSEKNLEMLIFDSIRKQMIADVPLGAFLSGGIDSSLVVSIMQNISSVPIKTFTIGFSSPEFNEAEFAKGVAKHLGTDHTELYLSPDDALNIIPNLSAIYDEPFADSSQIPTYYVAKLAKNNVSVALSGDAGDELFGGYSRYFNIFREWKFLQTIPKNVRNMGLTASKLGNLALTMLGKANSMENFKRKLLIAESLLKCSNFGEYYMNRISHVNPFKGLIIGDHNDRSMALFGTESALDSSMDKFSWMMQQDFNTYLPDDILVKVDRAAMAVSLETRVPFLDYHIIEAAWSLPLSYKTNEKERKKILRNILKKFIPKELIDRPKRGFAIPICDWLRGSLLDWAEGLISEERLLREGVFNSKEVLDLWGRHQSGNVDYSGILWNILVFQSWSESING